MITDIAHHRLWLCLAGSLLIHGLALFPSSHKSINGIPGARASLRATIVAKKHVQQFRISKSAAIPVSPVEKKPAIPSPAPPGMALPTAAPGDNPTPTDIPMEGYVDPDIVDQKAAAIDIPELPPPAGNATSPGLLRIKVFINLSGQPDYIEVLETTLPDEYVIVLTDMFRQAKFSPALQGDKAVNSWRIIEIIYGEPEATETPAPAR